MVKAAKAIIVTASNDSAVKIPPAQSAFIMHRYWKVMLTSEAPAAAGFVAIMPSSSDWSDMSAAIPVSAIPSVPIICPVKL